MTTAPAEYHLNPERFAALRRRMLLRMPLFLAAILGFMIVFQTRQPGGFQVVPFAATLVIAGVALAIGISRGVRRQREIWNSYTLTLDGDLLTRRQTGITVLSVKRGEIVRIREVATGGLFVETSDKGRVLVIPEPLVGYAEVRAVLAAWLPITPAPPSKAANYSWIGGLVLGLVPLAVTLVAKDRRTVVIAGSVTILVIVGSAITLLRHPNVDSRIKKGLWVMIVPLASVLLKILQALRS